MQSLARKILYTFVFSLECVLLFLLTFWFTEQFFPGFLLPVDAFGKELLFRLLITFTSIVLISFYGASYVVYGSLREPSYKQASKRASQTIGKKSSRRQPVSKRNKPPQGGRHPSMHRRPSPSLSGASPAPKRLRPGSSRRGPRIRP